MFSRDYAASIQTLLLIISNISCGPVGKISELMFSSIGYSDLYLTPRFRREDDTNSIPIVQTSHLIHPSESRVIAAAVCVSHCLRECVESLRRKSLTDISIEDVLTKLQAFPTQLQSECIWLSPGFLFYEECEQACTSDQPYNECLRMCESGDSSSGWSCHNGCRSLSAALKLRTGDCPPEIWPTIHRIPGLSIRAQSIGWIGGNKDSPNEIALEGAYMLGMYFTTRCSEDLECVRDREKCCQSRCREAIYRDDILPPAPTVQVLEANNPSSFILSWGQRDLGNNLSEPTVYVLQVKSYFGPDYDSQHAGAWRTLVMTTLMDAQLKEPLVGWWYQFQLTAVNRFGSRGFAFLSPPVQLSNQNPKPPSPPVNLTCNYMALQMNGTIAAEFQWGPPTPTSIPVTEYIVHLCLNVTGACSDVPNVPKICNKCNKIRPSGETSILLKSLKPGRPYVVMVQTITNTPASNSIETLDSKAISFTSSNEGLLSSMQNIADKQTMRIGREFYLYFETPKSSAAADTLRLVQRSICQPDPAFVLALSAVALSFSR